MSAFYIAAAHKSSGKTSLSIGLSAALRQLHNQVQCFKKGPDYIDPIWLTQSSSRNCFNLDFNTQSHEELLELFQQQSNNADITIVEGNKGLYDGVALDGSDSNAAMAKLLSIPVVLTIDTIGITRGIAPLLQGYQAFDPDVNIAGVILNKVGSSRHEKKLIAAIEHYTDLAVLGSVGFERSLEIPERHLGLMPANESRVAQEVIDRLSSAISNGVDLDLLRATTASKNSSYINSSKLPPKDIRIAIAKDAAFGFYYADDLLAFEKAGAELIPFNALNDETLPDVDGLFIGGGFPETQMDKLSSNHSLLAHIKKSIASGLPTYAECGGLMYLSEDITWQGETHTMVGAIPGKTNMHKRPQGRGYAKLQETERMPWPNIQKQTGSSVIPAHEFHYASLDNLPSEASFAYNVTRGNGITGVSDGIIIKNLLAGFSHQRNTKSNPWVERFVQFVRQCKQNHLVSE